MSNQLDFPHPSNGAQPMSHPPAPRWGFFPVLILVTLAACGAPAPSLPEHTTKPLQSSLSGFEVTPMCVEGCLDPDPDPEAVGYFLPGTRNQWLYCADGNADFDQDGLDDGCEYTLALTFAPELSFGLGDDVNREPRWAAQWLDGDPGSRTVRIAYLHSYWMDMGDGGSSSTSCGFFALFPIPGLLTSLETCGGHAGDSEWILLDVAYNFATKHWYLADARFSAHEWHVEFGLAPDSLLVSIPNVVPSYPAAVEYGDRPGGYPRAYVADRKHANYPTRQFCNDHGGVKHGFNSMSDVCSLPRYSERFHVDRNANLGSRHAPFHDCGLTTRTDHPASGLGRTECYWTTPIGVTRFRGWFPSEAGGSSTPYSSVLADHFGF